jgi:hypothetical protein
VNDTSIGNVRAISRSPASTWRHALFPLACLLCALPVLLSTYPPMVDLPQHAAQIASLKSMLLGSGWPYADMHQIKPFTPYWLGYLLVMALSFPFGIVWATKLVVAAAASLFAWSAARFCTRLGTDPTWNWMLLALPFGFAYHWGFLNFIVAAPFGFLFLSALLDLKGRSDWRACLRIALWLHFLFFAHVLATAFFCMIAMLLVASPWNGFRDWMRRCLPVFTILPLTGMWLWTSMLNSPRAGQILWQVGVERLTGLLPALVSVPSQWPGVLIGLFFLLVPFLTGASPKRSWIAWTPFGLYVAWMLFFPHDPGGVAFAYHRFGIFGLPLYLICFEKDATRPDPTHSTILRYGLAVTAFALLGWQCIRTLTFNLEVAGYREVIAHAEPGKRMMALLFAPGSHASTAPVMVHFGSWYQAEHDGLVDYSFASNWMQPLQYRQDAPRGIYQGFEWHPEALDWQRHRGDLYDYVLVKDSLDDSRWIHEKSAGTMLYLASSGDWQLYGRATHDAPDARENAAKGQP